MAMLRAIAEASQRHLAALRLSLGRVNRLNFSAVEPGAFIEYYSYRRYHESGGNLAPADVYFEQDQAILQEGERIKRRAIEHRRLLHRTAAA